MNTLYAPHYKLTRTAVRELDARQVRALLDNVMDGLPTVPTRAQALRDAHYIITLARQLYDLKRGSIRPAVRQHNH